MVKTRRILAWLSSVHWSGCDEHPNGFGWGAFVIVTRAGARWLFFTALLIVCAWPPTDGRSLIVKGVNWMVDPGGTLPVLPPQLGFGLSDYPQAVELHDAIVRRYDELRAEGGLSRMRLDLKVARDPFNPQTERQLLLVLGVVVAFLVVRTR